MHPDPFVAVPVRREPVEPVVVPRPRPEILDEVAAAAVDEAGDGEVSRRYLASAVVPAGGE